jgi:hypothetical protein
MSRYWKYTCSEMVGDAGAGCGCLWGGCRAALVRLDRSHTQHNSTWFPSASWIRAFRIRMRRPRRRGLYLAVLMRRAARAARANKKQAVTS